MPTASVTIDRTADVTPTTVSNTIVDVRGIGKTFPGGVEALRAIDLSIPRGELTTLLGPSGCGKTTLLKIIAGLIDPSAGEVWVNGKPTNGPGPERAFVFQDFALLPWSTVLRNVAFGLELRGVPQAERETIARKYIAEVRLEGFEDHYPHQLSGGMRQRVGLARALAVDADVLLMDEPFSAVDEQTRRKFQEELLRLLAVENKTVSLLPTASKKPFTYRTKSCCCTAGRAGYRKLSAPPSIALPGLTTSAATRPISTASTRSGATLASLSRCNHYDRIWRTHRVRLGAAAVGASLGSARPVCRYYANPAVY